MDKVEYIEVTAPISPEEVLELLKGIQDYASIGDADFARSLKAYLHYELDNAIKIHELVESGKELVDYETILQVANRLGFIVPENYLERLINFVRHYAPEQFIYSINPVTELENDCVISYSPEVESNVKQFCVKHSFVNTMLQ
ncbi:MAG: hypothetical protein F6K34_01185 [Okeania sp. SIO4D6]|nr:hypothetical protein [Okeania sp. SIO4D6]